MAADPLNLYTELRKLPLSSLHELLRTIEKGKERYTEADRAAQMKQTVESIASTSRNTNKTFSPLGPLRPGPQAMTPDLSMLTQLLSTWYKTTDDNQGGSHHRNYDQLHQKFRDFETQLRKQKHLVDKLLSHGGATKEDAGATGPVGLQQTIFIQCPRGGRSGARFRVINRTSRSALVRARVSEFRGERSQPVDDAMLTFSPVDYTLESGEATIVSAMVDLTRCPEITTDEVHVAADVLLDDQPALKLWVNVEVYDEFRE